MPFGWLKRRPGKPDSPVRETLPCNLDAGTLSELATAGRLLASGASEAAARHYESIISSAPRHAPAWNYLGAAHGNLGNFRRAEHCFRKATELAPTYAEAYCNLGAALRAQARLTEAQAALEEALRLEPNSPDALASLAITLLALGRPREAKPHFAAVLNQQPLRTDAMQGMAQVERAEGHFAKAESLLNAVLRIDPNAADALASIPHLRKMTPADRSWVRRAERRASQLIAPFQEANLRFAIGKFYDDIEDYPRAFHSYERANRLLKSTAAPYDRNMHRQFVDDMIRAYSHQCLIREATATDLACASSVPVFIVGMPRSGTSLVEQILASHPLARGAGELNYWTVVVNEREGVIRRGPPARRDRPPIAKGYLEVLRQHGDAMRMIDKAPINADYLGLIHIIFPNARIINIQRDPIDTCLSCYFQQFSAALKFTMDLGDLAHYYRQHHRLLTHWRSVLPPEAFMDVTYEELVAHPESWSRKLVTFLDLEWDARCLSFHETSRVVATASAWQVRQKIYTRSIGRWKHYQQFIEPLLNLRELAN